MRVGVGELPGVSTTPLVGGDRQLGVLGARAFHQDEVDPAAELGRPRLQTLKQRTAALAGDLVQGVRREDDDRSFSVQLL